MTSKQLVIETEFYLYIKVGLYSKRNSEQISVLYFIKIKIRVRTILKNQVSR